MNKLYPLVSLKLFIWGISGILILILGVLITIYGEAPLIGKTILMISSSIIATILVFCTIKGIDHRYDIREKIVAIFDSVLVLNDTNADWQVSSFVQKLPKDFLDILVDDLNKSLIDLKFSRENFVELADLDPITFCYIKPKGQVRFQWGTFDKIVKGLQKGHVVEVEWITNMYGLARKEEMIKLIKHEIGHVFLSSKDLNINDQHRILGHIGL